MAEEAAAAKRAKAKGTALRIVIAAVVVLAVIFGASQLMGDDSDADEAADTEVPDTSLPEMPTTTAPSFTDPALAEEVLGREAPTPEPPPDDTPADALETTTLIEGQGEGAQAGDTVYVHYTGVLSDGTQFDSSWERGDPFPVQLGVGQVIVGWDEGLIGAKPGERRHLLIGSDNAYGAQGQGQIPPGAPLAFDVDVIDVQPGG